MSEIDVWLPRMPLSTEHVKAHFVPLDSRAAPCAVIEGNPWLDDELQAEFHAWDTLTDEAWRKIDDEA